ncbi:MAG: Rieske (2Fe-2S) protein [Frankia sp.]
MNPAAETSDAAVVHQLGPLTDIPVGEARAYPAGDRQIAVFRLRSGEVRAVDAACPHAGGPLADGQADSQTVICPLHGHTFDLATGTSSSGAPSLTCYPIRVGDDGIIEIGIG